MTEITASSTIGAASRYEDNEGNRFSHVLTLNAQVVCPTGTYRLNPAEAFQLDSALTPPTLATGFRAATGNEVTYNLATSPIAEYCEEQEGHGLPARVRIPSNDRTPE